MRCSLTEACPNCPFKKNATEQAKNLILDNPLKESKKALSDNGYACFDSRQSEIHIQCAGATIHASLQEKVFKNKKLRFYQMKLGKNSEILNSIEFITYYQIKKED